MPRSLADGHIRLAILNTQPAIPERPTKAELDAGVDASCAILASDFQWGATTSERITGQEPLCAVNTQEGLGKSVFNATLTAFRYFDSSDEAETAGQDATFQLLKEKGATLWIYARNTSKLSTDDWETEDEIYLGGEVITDEPQRPTDAGGYIRYTVPLLFQQAWPFTQVGPVVTP